MTLARLCAAVDADMLARSSTDRIRRELPQYQILDAAEHTEAVRKQHCIMLEALAQERTVAGQALVAASELARSRALQGIDIEVLIGAYHLTDQALWQALVAAADAETSLLLPRAASLMFASLHAVSTVMSAAHAEASQALHSRRVTASQRLLELLLFGKVDAEARAHARAIGLDPDGDFVAAAWRHQDSPATVMPAEVMRALEDADAVFAVGQIAAEGLLVCQKVNPASLGKILAPVLKVGRAGVGLLRGGLEGAAESLGDAQLAAEVPAEEGEAQRVVFFENVWPDACVLRESSRLAGLLQPARDVAAAHPHLATAVLAFARADMQIARAAQELHLHANSLSYRLDRWGALTGWHPRTFEGLRRSLLAIGSAAATRDGDA